MIPKTALFLLLLLTLPLASASIGCEENGEILKCWNEGTIAPNGTTYFNITSGLLQQANTIDRLKDVTYYYGISRNVSGIFTFWGLDDIPADYLYYSDELSYWYAESWKDIHIGAFRGFGRKLNVQELYDDYVRMKYYFESERDFNGDYYFTTAMIDQDAGSDGIPDFLIIELANGSFLNWPMNVSWYNITENVIDVSIHGTYSYHLLFPEPITLIFDNTLNKVNGDLYFLHHIGNVEEDVLYDFTQYWIDVSCSINCGFGCSTTVYFTGINETIYITQNVSTFLKYNWLCIFGGSCIYSADCALDIEYNTSSDWEKLTDSTNTPIECYDPSCSLKVSDITKNVYYDYNLTGNKYRENDLRASISGYYPTINTSVDVVKIFTTLWLPPNNENRTAYFTEGNWWANLSANASVVNPENMTSYIKVNSTSIEENYTFYGANFTQNITLNSSGNWTWDVLACKDDFCWLSTMGAWSFFIDEAQPPPPPPPPPLAEEEETDEDIVYFFLIGGILFVVAMFIHSRYIWGDWIF